jgi:hypothetical protein
MGPDPERCLPGGVSEVLFRHIDAATVDQYVTGACTLTGDERRATSDERRATSDERQMLLTVHEVGHAFAVHAVGLEYGEIKFNPESPEPETAEPIFSGSPKLSGANRRVRRGRPRC